ncbi:hypothetical protein ACFL6I_22675, partial [candidate division KSB1 bacterium]
IVVTKEMRLGIQNHLQQYPNGELSAGDIVEQMISDIHDPQYKIPPNIGRFIDEAIRDSLVEKHKLDFDGIIYDTIISHYTDMTFFPDRNRCTSLRIPPACINGNPIIQYSPSGEEIFNAIKKRESRNNGSNGRSL